MQKKIAMYVLLLVAAASVLGLAGCGNRPGAIKGRVTDGQSDQALAQARVEIYSLSSPEGSGSVSVYQKGTVLQEQVTDDKGTYAFSLEPGTYVVQVWVNDQKVGDRMVKVGPGRTTQADFQVEIPSP